MPGQGMSHIVQDVQMASFLSASRTGISELFLTSSLSRSPHATSGLVWIFPQEAGQRARHTALHWNDTPVTRCLSSSVSTKPTAHTTSEKPSVFLMCLKGLWNASTACLASLYRRKSMLHCWQKAIRPGAALSKYKWRADVDRTQCVWKRYSELLQVWKEQILGPKSHSVPNVLLCARRLQSPWELECQIHSAIKIRIQTDIVIHTLNSITWDAEAGGCLWVKARLVNIHSKF